MDAKGEIVRISKNPNILDSERFDNLCTDKLAQEKNPRILDIVEKGEIIRIQKKSSEKKNPKILEFQSRRNKKGLRRKI